MKKLYIESYGCQMNLSDSEVVSAIMEMSGYEMTTIVDEATAIFVNTCSIRSSAEDRVVQRLRQFGQLRKGGRKIIIGVLGCMAERVQSDLIELYGVDLVAGPDSYMDLPALVAAAELGERAINVSLSEIETYDEVLPKRLGGTRVSGFVSIMRGCNNFCSYCIVPYTRGRERSRSISSIGREIADLRKRGFREVVLLGQNVNSYLYKDVDGEDVDFAGLLQFVSEAAGEMRVRFTTSHPKDMSDSIIAAIGSKDNICGHVHLPVQSGSNHVLGLMKRGYSREWYIERVSKIRSELPGCCVTTDIMVGFDGERLRDHQETVSLMEEVKFESAFMFRYSERPGTLASRRGGESIDEAERIRRLEEVIVVQQRISHSVNQEDIGKRFEVMVEGVSKRSREELFGRTLGNKVVVFRRSGEKIGDRVVVSIVSASSATLRGEVVSE